MFFSLTTLQPPILTPSYQLNINSLMVVTLLKNKGYNPLTTAYNQNMVTTVFLTLINFNSG